MTDCTIHFQPCFARVNTTTHDESNPSEHADLLAFMKINPFLKLPHLRKPRRLHGCLLLERLLFVRIHTDPQEMVRCMHAQSGIIASRS